jgi:anion-transporting  ArsA/GET3 family ATPase
MRKSTPKKLRLAVFVGAGGVGKTTLSASFAVAAASAGKHVVLMSIDPAKRLRTALSLPDLSDELTEVSLPQEGGGSLLVAQLDIEGCFCRWVCEQGMPESLEKKLVGHVFFQTLVSRLASTSDAFAAVRIAEIIEQNPHLDLIVVDTPPGLHALDFLTKPERMREFLESKTVDWIKWMGKDHAAQGGIFSRVLKKGTDKILEGLSKLGGHSFLTAFSELLLLSEGVFERMSARLEYASKVLRGEESEFVLVSAVREDALCVSEELAHQLRSLRCHISLAILNRTVSHELRTDAGFANFLRDARTLYPESRAFVNYVSSWLEKQEVSRRRMDALCGSVLEIPLVAGLDGESCLRAKDLAELGAPIQRVIFERSRK